MRGGWDNHRCHNKKPRYDIGVGMWMMSCPEEMGWGFRDLKKKTVSWVLDLDGVSWFSEIAEAKPVWVYGMPARWLSQWVERWQCTNSQHSKKLFFSLPISENLKLKKVNKSFVPEPISCFSDSYAYAYKHYEHSMNLRTFHVFVDYDYVTAPFWRVGGSYSYARDAIDLF